ncbi:DASS family sodium-coupled anion symporter [Gallaecimonas sp. GXIMD4217]|uniref:SLC13 family permease n=1 Tax=Gallaecimonas sp. GXIMD4217 TaxID=3131927 RepID=UPI00311B3DFF
MLMRLLLAGLALVAALLMLLFGPWPGPVTLGLSLLLAVAALWMTEVIPVMITALAVPLLAVLLGVFDVKAALAAFSHPVLFLFLGGFALASALKSQGLDLAMANAVIHLAGGRLWLAVLMLLLTAALLSMWISNTATAAMMLPLMLGLLQRAGRLGANSLVFALLGLAYSASIGGMGTLVGSPPNAIAAAYLKLSFLDWLALGLPLVALLWPLMLAVLWWQHRPQLAKRMDWHQQGRLQWTGPRIMTLAIFALTVAGWMLSGPLSRWLGGIAQFDSLVALAAVVAIGATRVASWDNLKRDIDWGVLLLFGGGLTLSAVLKETGTSAFLAESLSGALGGAPQWLLLGAVALFVVLLTELASNTASAALLVPLFGGIAQGLGLDPRAMAMLIAFAASCAFMLPVATPPNAIVFGSGQVPQLQMMRSGLRLNLLCVLVLTLYFSLV